MKAATVPKGAIRGAEAHEIPGVEAAIWTERMVSALVNGVEGGQWYSLMDKVYAPKTLGLAWERVRTNRGAAGVDGQPIINAGPTPSLPLPGCSPYTPPGSRRETPDEETTDWRAVCGRTACTVRREGR
jgi:hypothetical protein